MTLRESGDGDYCPQNPIHGRMWVMASKRQWCPSAKHKGSQFYEYDGKTPVHASWSPLDAAHPRAEPEIKRASRREEPAVPGRA